MPFRDKEKFEEITEAIQESTRILGEQEEKISAKLKIEIFYDDPVVRDLVRDISIARDSVKICENILNTIIVEEIVPDEEDKD